MRSNRTFSIIKPDATKAGKAAEIEEILVSNGFKIIHKLDTQLDRERAESFYGVHKGRDFFERLIDFMTSGPIVAIVLEKENAVADFRKLIGATNPEDAEEGTIRNLFGTSTTFNAVHGSDSDENAQIESDFFFSTTD